MLRGRWLRSFKMRSDAKAFVRLFYPSATIETITYSRA